MIELTYNAKTADEFKTLAEWLRDNGFGGAPRITRELPPKETEWLNKNGASRMKLTKEEKARVDAGLATREDIAAERLATATPADTQESGEEAGEVF